METLGQRLKYALEQMGINETELANRIGNSQQAINFIVSGKTTNPRNLAKIAAELGISEVWLRYGTGSPDDKQSTAPAIKGGSFGNAAKLRVGTDEAPSRFAHPSEINDLPVYGIPAGMDGIELDLTDPVAYTGRPPMLHGNRRGFAVYMNGESMSPRFDHGEMLWIDPVQPPQVGDYVLVVDTNGFAVPRQLTEFKSETITVLARNDETESIRTRKDIRYIYKIVGARSL